jgi:hypothetical protein
MRICDLNFFAMTENELATIAVDICYKMHTTLGPGLLESVYEAAFVHELIKNDLRGSRKYLPGMMVICLTLDFGQILLLRISYLLKSNRLNTSKEFIIKWF